MEKLSAMPYPVYLFPDEGKWVAIAPDFPRCSAVAPMPDEALYDIQIVIRSVCEMMTSSGRALPTPFTNTMADLRAWPDREKVTMTIREELRKRLGGVRVEVDGQLWIHAEAAEAWPCDGEGDEYGNYVCKKEKRIKALEAELEALRGGKNVPLPYTG